MSGNLIESPDEILSGQEELTDFKKYLDERNEE